MAPCTLKRNGPPDFKGTRPLGQATATTIEGVHLHRAPKNPDLVWQSLACLCGHPARRTRHWHACTDKHGMLGGMSLSDAWLAASTCIPMQDSLCALVPGWGAEVFSGISCAPSVGCARLGAGYLRRVGSGCSTGCGSSNDSSYIRTQNHTEAETETTTHYH